MGAAGEQTCKSLGRQGFEAFSTIETHIFGGLDFRAQRKAKSPRSKFLMHALKINCHQHLSGSSCALKYAIQSGGKHNISYHPNVCRNSRQ